MPRATISIKKEGGVPEVEITIGQAQFGKYQLILWDSNGKNPTVIGTGTNDDDVIDVVKLGSSVTELDNRVLSWEIIISSPSGGAGNLYSTKVDIRQDGQTIQDFKESGALEGGTIVFGSVNLKAN